MKELGDIQKIQSLQVAQRGVFSKADLQALLNEKHPAAFVRRVRTLEQANIIQRFIRGWYIAEACLDLATLSQRLSPESYVSFGTVLAESLVVGTKPEREVWAAKCGRSRSYGGGSYRIEHLGLAEHLLFGFEMRQGVRWATPEKALLDTLYFHLHGQRYPFDIYSDLHLRGLDKKRLAAYLARYRHAKFAAFAQSIIHAQR